MVAGTLFFLTFIGFSWPFLGLWSIMVVEMVLLQIPWCDLLVLSPRGVGWFMRFGTGHFCPGHLVFEIQNGLMCLLPLSVLLTLLIGLFSTGLLVKWVAFFLEPCIGLLAGWILGLVAFLMLSCLFFKSCGLVRGCPLKRRFLAIFGQGV